LQLLGRESTLIHRLVGRVRSWVEKPGVGYALLGLSVLIALTQVYYVYYNLGDEGDNLATGWLLANGFSLYKDIFSHHFPFPYLWIAAIVKLFGPSLLAARLSLVFLRMVVFAVTMRVSRYYLAIGLTSLAWSLVGYLYLGNGLFYQSFSGFFIVGSFALGLRLVSGQNQTRRSTLFLTGIFLSLAIMSDPLMTFPTFILIAAVAISSISKTLSFQNLKVAGFRSMMVIAGLVTGLLPVLLYLLIHSSLNDFYQCGILFNSQVYSHYSPQISFNEVIKPVREFLGLFEESWRYYLSPFYEWETFEFLDHWIFTGFFFRLVIFLGAVAFLLKRKFLGALFVFLFGAMVLIRSERYFHASPFVFLSLFCASWLISKGFVLLSPVLSKSGRKDPNELAPIGVNILASVVWIILIAAFSWLNIRGGKFLMDNRSELEYSGNFSSVKGNADFLKKATCNLEKARVLLYPLDPVQYFLAEIPPSSKFHYMTPWVAEIAQNQVIDDLRTGLHLVYVDRGIDVWGYPVEDYLSELLVFLNGAYVQIEPNYFASPDLLLECPYGRE